MFLPLCGEQTVRSLCVQATARFLPLSVGGTGDWLVPNRIQQGWRPDVASLAVLCGCNSHLAPRLSPLPALMGPPSQELAVTPANGQQAARLMDPQPTRTWAAGSHRA